MNKLVVIAGTNASGKSGLGIELAAKYGAEIISADSRQVYRGLDLGSGKVTQEEMKGVPHHLLDVVEPNAFFSLKDFQRLAYAAADDIIARGKIPFLVGGTGLYINAVADGYNISESEPNPELRRQVENMTLQELTETVREADPEALSKMDLKNKRRLERAVEKIKTGVPLKLESVPRYKTLVLGVTWDRQVLYGRIEERLDRRLEQGMIGEVERLVAEGATDDFLYGLGLEYRYILMYLRGHYATKELFREELFKEIRHLAKEQMTWFRKRNDMHWLNMEADPVGEASGLIDAFLKE